MLVGSHGANLANAIWAAPPLSVVEVATASRAPFSNYLHLCRALGFEHWLLPLPPAPASPDEFAAQLWETVSDALGGA